MRVLFILSLFMVSQAGCAEADVKPNNTVKNNVLSDDVSAANPDLTSGRKTTRPLVVIDGIEFGVAKDQPVEFSRPRITEPLAATGLMTYTCPHFKVEIDLSFNESGQYMISAIRNGDIAVSDENVKKITRKFSKKYSVGKLTPDICSTDRNSRFSRFEVLLLRYYPNTDSHLQAGYYHTSAVFELDGGNIKFHKVPSLK